MPQDKLILIGVILGIGSVIQSAAGFGFGMFSISGLLLVGLEPQVAITCSSICSFSQTVLATWRFRRFMDWKRLGRLVAIGLPMVPVGAMLLGLLKGALSPEQVKQALGFLILLVLGIQLAIKPVPKERVHPGWTVLTMGSAGIMSGMAGMAGSPIVLWLLAHKWSSLEKRLTLWGVFLCFFPVQVGSLYLRFGDSVASAAGIAVFYIPIVLLMAGPGFWLGRSLHPKVQKGLIIGLLTLTAGAAALGPWVGAWLKG